MNVLLETERLVLRRWTLDDIDALFAIFGDPEVMKYVSLGKPVSSRDRIRERWGDRIQHYDDGEFRMWAVVEKKDGEVVGNAGFGVVDNTSETEIAYHFARKAWGRGYATEAAGALLGYGIETLGYDFRILGLTYQANKPSQNVLEKIGFTFDGIGHYFGVDDLSVHSCVPDTARRGKVVNLQKDMAAPLDVVFRALSDPADLTVWFTTRAVFEPWVGGEYRNGDHDRGTIWTYLPPHRLRFTWDNAEHAPGTVVDIRLEERDPGTRLVLEHSGLGGPAEAEDLHGGWSWALDSLSSFVERGKPISHEAWLAGRRGS